MLNPDRFLFIHVQTPPHQVVSVGGGQPFVLPLLTLGGLWLVLVPLRIRWAGAVPMLVALLAWSVAERPALLVSADAAIVGLMTDQGRAFSTMKGGKFIGTNWMEDDGDLTPLKEAGRRTGFDLTDQGLAFALGHKRGLVVAGETGADRLAALCRSTDLLIIVARKDKAAVPAVSPAPCQVIHPEPLRLSGPLSLTLSDGGWITRGVVEVQGQRLWSGKPLPPPRLAAVTGLVAASGLAP